MVPPIPPRLMWSCVFRSSRTISGGLFREGYIHNDEYMSYCYTPVLPVANIIPNSPIEQYVNWIRWKISLSLVVSLLRLLMINGLYKSDLLCPFIRLNCPTVSIFYYSVCCIQAYLQRPIL